MTDDSAPPWLAHCVRRGKPLLGTLVTIRLERIIDAGDAHVERLHAAADAAFAAIAHVGRVMSAHRAASDLGRLARAAPGTVLALDPHTVRVLRAARRWQSASSNAFDPAAAARRLAVAGLRPAFTEAAMPDLVEEGRLAGLRFIDERHVRLAAPLRLDLGGIAKGYAVDLAVATLRAGGAGSGLVDAGGDMRAFGPRRWPVRVVRRAAAPRAAGRTDAIGPRGLRDAALATSETGWAGSEFIDSRRQPVRRHTVAPRRAGPGSASSATSRCCTVQAPDCIDADALTKWGLQAELRATSPLGRALRAARATMWQR